MKGSYGDTEIECFCSSETQRHMDSSKILLVQSDSKGKPKIIMRVLLLEVIYSMKFLDFFSHSFPFLLSCCQE